MMLRASFPDPPARWTTCGFRILLFCLLCACGSDSTTALRFAVYSDAELSRIEVSVLDADGSRSDAKTWTKSNTPSTTPPAPTLSNHLFTVLVELTSHSKRRDDAELLLEGYSGDGDAKQLVLRQTVSADFKDGQTRLVRIWLAHACAGKTAPPCDLGRSCDFEQGCVDESKLVSVRYEGRSSHEDERWVPDRYHACGARSEDGTGSDGYCLFNCSQPTDTDCAWPAGSQCKEDAECASKHCEPGCVGAGCTLKRCCAAACMEPCSVCAEDGTCKPFVNSDQVDNCGACGVVCPPAPNATPACVGGQCQLACDVGFEDCMTDVSGCETDLATSGQHCGGCSTPTHDRSCRYHVCRNRECLGTLLPPAPSMNTATQVYGLYLRRVTLGRRTILALGAKFQAAEGDVRLVLMDEVDRRPGRILAFGTVPALDAVTDEKGEQHGAEYIFTDPITPTGEAFWIGFESTETVQLIDLGKPDELLLPSAQELTIGASFAPEVMTPLGGLDGSPYVYAIYL